MAFSPIFMLAKPACIDVRDEPGGGTVCENRDRPRKCKLESENNSSRSKKNTLKYHIQQRSSIGYLCVYIASTSYYFSNTCFSLGLCTTPTSLHSGSWPFICISPICLVHSLARCLSACVCVFRSLALTGRTDNTLQLQRSKTNPYSTRMSYTHV